MNLAYSNSWVYKFKKISCIFIAGYTTTSSFAQDIPNEITFLNLANQFHITPSFSTTETWTSNLYSNTGNKVSGRVTEVSPGINAIKSTGRIKGYLNYSLNILNYSGGDGRDSINNSLNSSINSEIIEGHGFVDATGLITQQTISAFALQTNNNNYNKNKTEISTYGISPYYRGNLSNIFDYEVRYSLATMRAKNNDNFSSNDRTAIVSLNGNEIFKKLSWGINARSQFVSRKNSPDTEVDKLNISLNYLISDKLVISVSSGREVQNYITTEKESSRTSGIGLNWSISEMTKLSANAENNPLGKMHSVNFAHRTPRTSWSVSDVKSVSLSNSKITPSLGSNYDLLFSQFSSIEPDPIKRSQLVNNYLQLNGISPNSTAINGYLTAGTSLQHAQNITFALLGVRDTVTFTAARSIGKKIGLVTIAASDDLNNSSSIRQDGYTISYTHRLTADTVLNNQFSNQKIYGELYSQNSELKSVNLSASTRIGSKAFFTMSARHSISSSPSSAYKETAVIGNLTLQF